MLLSLKKRFTFLRIKSIELVLFVIDYFTVYKKLRTYYKTNIRVDNPLIIDVGANKGQTINFFLGIFSKSKIIAFEPNLRLYNTITRKYNYLPNVQTVNKGVSNQTGKLLFQETVTDQTSTFEELNYKSDYLKIKSRVLGCNPEDMVVAKYEVDVIKLSDFINDEKVDHINILKIDTEGHEFNCLKGLFCDKTPQIDIIQLEHHNDDMYLNSKSEESMVTLLEQNKFILHNKIKHLYGDFYELLFKKVNS